MRDVFEGVPRGLAFPPEIVTVQTPQKIYTLEEIRAETQTRIGQFDLDVPVVVIGVAIKSTEPGEPIYCEDNYLGRYFEENNTYYFSSNGQLEGEATLLQRIGLFMQEREDNNKISLANAVVVLNKIGVQELLAACFITGSLPLEAMNSMSTENMQELIENIIDGTRRRRNPLHALHAINYYLHNANRAGKYPVDKIATQENPPKSQVFPTRRSEKVN